jgi:Zn-dependent peptidase ImmA (M78 family)/predicted secreted protein
MVDARRAILTGTQEAVRTHRQLHWQERWEEHGGRIDVFDAIDRFGLPLVFRPMEGLLGAYLSRPVPGVLISTRRPLSIRRCTAAHELGHFRLGHEPSLDGEDMLGRSPFAGRQVYDQMEMEADAFAISFLIPRWFVAGQMRRHGWGPADMREPGNVYQLALRAGVSYEGTCYALRNHRVIDRRACAALVAVQPKDIKRSYLPDYEPPSWHLDVWRLGSGDDGTFVEASSGDVIEISLLEHSGGGYLWDVAGLEQSELEILQDQRNKADAGQSVGGHVCRHLTTRARAPGFGSIRFVENRPWERGTEPVSTYQFSYDISDATEPGLLRAQRDRMLGRDG